MTAAAAKVLEEVKRLTDTEKAEIRDEIFEVFAGDFTDKFTSQEIAEIDAALERSEASFKDGRVYSFEETFDFLQKRFREKAKR